MLKTQNLCREYTGDFYDKDYFENGRIVGKSWLMNYRWMPQRSFREALAIIDYLKLDSNSRVLDFGCAKGFLVRALRELEINAEGCDISRYALGFAPPDCWNVEDEWEGKKGKYTHIVCKDVLEHFNEEQLKKLLVKLKDLARVFMAVIPMGDEGIYRINEYHSDISHILANDESWWEKIFTDSGWEIEKDTNHVRGIKDNWQSYANGIGNHVYVLRCR